MKSPSARAEGQSGTHGPANVGAESPFDYSVGGLAGYPWFSGLLPFGAVGPSRLVEGVGSRFEVPTTRWARAHGTHNAPFSYWGGRSSQVGKRISLTVVSWGIVYY